MSDIRIQHLGKCFRQYRSEWHRVANWFGARFQPESEFWALRDVDIDVPSGAAVGVIGQNGAGKSTLLKLLTGTLAPTEGSIQIDGRVSAILELGMGFDPELTGRQNVFHAAGLQGFDSETIAARMGEIEAFAEIGEHFDAPVRTYSSGMQMRVAFAVATAWRPDVLIVDEALSVGDTYFQHKSFARIREFLEQGTTLLLVSHDRSAIQALCDRAFLLESGRVTCSGEPDAVFDYYNARLAAGNDDAQIEQTTDIFGKTQTRSGTARARIKEAGLYDFDGQPVDCVRVGQRVSLKVIVRIQDVVPELVIGYLLRDRIGQAVFGTNTAHTGHVLEDLCPGEQVEATFCFPANLGEGGYVTTVALHAGESHTDGNYDWWDRVNTFEVVNVGQPTFQGMAWLPPEVKVERHD